MGWIIELISNRTDWIKLEDQIKELTINPLKKWVNEE